jgi:hypothetical protein
VDQAPLNREPPELVHDARFPVSAPSGGSTDDPEPPDRSPGRQPGDPGLPGGVSGLAQLLWIRDRDAPVTGTYQALVSK